MLWVYLFNPHIVRLVDIGGTDFDPPWEALYIHSYLPTDV